MARTRVKICGLTRSADVDAAVASGADAIGFVFHPASARAVTVEQARALRQRLPAFVSAVGLFVDAPADTVGAIAAEVGLDLLQFHGEEAPEFCAGFGRRWIKAVRMRPEVDLTAAQERYAGSGGLLLDTYEPGRAGGTGRTFDWSRIPAEIGRGAILAGGLTADNVAAAIRRVRPFAVDVSGGVEAERGIKDPLKLNAFMQGVQDGDRYRARG